MKRRISVFVLIWIQCIAFGQMQDYRFSRPITGITDTWHKVELPQDIFHHMKDDLSDLRMYGVTAHNDTIEAAYLLKVRSPKVDKVVVPLEILNQYKKRGRSYFTLQIPSKEAINRIQLDFDTTNFDYKVSIEGSYDQKDWFSIAKNKRIVSVYNSKMDYNYTILDFDESKYEYYRLSFKSKREPRLTSATTFLYNTTPGNSVGETILLRPFENKKDKLTRFDIELDNARPIYKLNLNVLDTFDYYRRVEIEYVIDSMNESYVYGHLCSGMLSSLESNDFVFSSRKLQKIRVYVYNDDNQPLRFSNARAYTYQHELIVRFTKPASYYLVYGNQNVWKPNYDIKMFEDKIPKDLKVVEVGSEGASSELSINPVEQEPLFKNKLWLWILLVAIILLLGWFTYRMMSNADTD